VLSAMACRQRRRAFLIDRLISMLFACVFESEGCRSESEKGCEKRAKMGGNGSKAVMWACIWSIDCWSRSSMGLRRRTVEVRISDASRKSKGLAARQHRTNARHLLPRAAEPAGGDNQGLRRLALGFGVVTGLGRASVPAKAPCQKQSACSEQQRPTGHRPRQSERHARRI